LASLIQEVGEASLNLVELSIVLCIVDLWPLRCSPSIRKQFMN